MATYFGVNCFKCSKNISNAIEVEVKSKVLFSNGDEVRLCAECRKEQITSEEKCGVSFCLNYKTENSNYCIKHNDVPMKIQLIDYNREMAEAFKIAFADVLKVEVHNNSAFAIPTECIVSPANSFGFMDGGFDATITTYLGVGVQIAVQDKIRKEYNGELLVGQALYVETGNSKIPYCISAPTMRVPTFLGPKSVNAYLAARAIFIILKNNPPFKTVTIPGLGTGVGAVPYDVCAKQMRQAYDDFYVNDAPKFPMSWHEAQLEHQMLYEVSKENTKDIQFGL